MKLTIGMATYKAFNEVWATIQSLRMYHHRVLQDVEILVVDNAGDDRLQRFMSGWNTSPHRYVRDASANGPAAAKQRVFEEAAGEWVLLIDSHILFPEGVIYRLMEWIDDHRQSRDLYQGPLLYDDLRTVADCMNSEFGTDGLWGTWHTGTRGPGADQYPIEMHGCGLMLCRKDAWLGFSPHFRGFGGEEGYIHEKFRQAGQQVICLPWLRWDHLFKEKGDAPYSINGEDRVRNYVIGFQELGLDMTPLNNVYGVEKVARLLRETEWMQLQRKEESS